MQRSGFLWKYILILILSAVLFFSIGRAFPAGTQNNTPEDSPETIVIPDDADAEKEIGAFEITAYHRLLAAENERGLSVLDAGRGNPNWINTITRTAYTRLMNFAVEESGRTYSVEHMGGQAEEKGIYERFQNAMDPSDENDAFLLKAAEYCIKEYKADPDALIKEFADGIIGDYYPSPSRCLTYTEKILNDYLESVLYNGVHLKDETLVFPTEGGSAAIVYIFNALSHNRVLKKGDTIAIGTPIFTPYLQIPDVDSYQLVSVNVESSAEEHWDIPEEEIEKLRDPSVKAFFLVNPSNPASYALSEKTLEQLKDVVKDNPGLIIITDDVYGTFAENFQTVYAVLPHNTILVYSFSKLYGATGWRIGMVAMNQDNVVDRLIRELPKADADILTKEYSIVTEHPAEFPFAERIVADSRSIGLYHTSGLSTPQQIFMDLLALSHLCTGEKDPYIELSNEVVSTRYHILMEGLKLPEDDIPENAQYYVLVSLKELAAAVYSEDFAEWLDEQVDCRMFLDHLAGEYGVVLMYGPGFGASQDTVRISLANLQDEQYRELADRLHELMAKYYESFLQETGTGS